MARRAAAMGVREMLNRFVPLVTEANSYDVENPYVESCGEYSFFPRLDDSTQYSTVYQGDKPVGTLSRRRVTERTGPVWTLYAIDSTVLRKWTFAPRYTALARGSVLKLSNFAKGR